MKLEKLILSWEQYYIDTLALKYNILIKAGLLLGFQHSEESKAKISESLCGKNHPMYGKNHTAGGPTVPPPAGCHRPPGGAETIALMMKPKTEETKAKMSIAKSTAIFVYSSDGKSLINTFPSATKAAEYFKVCHKLY